MKHQLVFFHAAISSISQFCDHGTATAAIKQSHAGTEVEFGNGVKHLNFNNDEPVPSLQNSDSVPFRERDSRLFLLVIMVFHSGFGSRSQQETKYV